ncbi:hypothetical protein BLNAU_24639 [Blattamonas nauphoetae]|uniref:Uncharacterized protein n=1 Tax=Blattamonas nauphoetae TaxID=2049346 RepID=A0ABQ9WQZ5_9EUKA|nr:hypothetical protein BLNAU_24639 [Blattamonas nauphoetae]
MALPSNSRASDRLSMFTNIPSGSNDDLDSESFTPTIQLRAQRRFNASDNLLDPLEISDSKLSPDSSTIQDVALIIGNLQSNSEPLIHEAIQSLSSIAFKLDSHPQFVDQFVGMNGIDVLIQSVTQLSNDSMTSKMLSILINLMIKSKIVSNNIAFSEFTNHIDQYLHSDDPSIVCDTLWCCSNLSADSQLIRTHLISSTSLLQTIVLHIQRDSPHLAHGLFLLRNLSICQNDNPAFDTIFDSILNLLVVFTDPQFIVKPLPDKKKDNPPQADLLVCLTHLVPNNPVRMASLCQIPHLTSIRTIFQSIRSLNLHRETLRLISTITDVSDGLPPNLAIFQSIVESGLLQAVLPYAADIYRSIDQIVVRSSKTLSSFFSNLSLVIFQIYYNFIYVSETYKFMLIQCGIMQQLYAFAPFSEIPHQSSILNILTVFSNSSPDVIRFVSQTGGFPLIILVILLRTTSDTIRRKALIAFLRFITAVFALPPTESQQTMESPSEGVLLYKLIHECELSTMLESLTTHLNKTVSALAGTIIDTIHEFGGEPE